MKIFPHRFGLALFLASIGLNLFLLAGFAGGVTGSLAVEYILKKRLGTVTAPLSAARQDEIGKELEQAFRKMEPHLASVRTAQQRWLLAFEQPALSQAELQRQMQAIRQHREAAQAELHQHALEVISGMSTSERLAVAQQIRASFDVKRPIPAAEVLSPGQGGTTP